MVVGLGLTPAALTIQYSTLYRLYMCGPDVPKLPGHSTYLPHNVPFPIPTSTCSFRAVALQLTGEL